MIKNVETNSVALILMVLHKFEAGTPPIAQVIGSCHRVLIL